MTRKQTNKRKFISYIKKNWKKAATWLSGMIIGLLLTKTCDRIWPDEPVVIKEHTDTVKVIHEMSPLPADSDTIMRKRIEQQLMNLELLNKYEKQIKGRIQDNKVEPCKMILGNPYPNGSGYTVEKASSFCLIEMRNNGPVVDLIFSFIREDYVEQINALEVNISKMNEKEGKDYVLLDCHYEPQYDKKDMLVRIVDNMSPGNYTIDAGFVLKEDRMKKYPTYYRQTFRLKK